MGNLLTEKVCFLKVDIDIYLLQLPILGDSQRDKRVHGENCDGVNQILR